MPEVSEKQEKLWQDVVCFCCDSASRMKKNVHNDLKWTKPESSLFVFQKLCHFLDSIIKEGLKGSKPTLNVVDFAMLPGALSKYARALQAESSEKRTNPSMFGIICPDLLFRSYLPTALLPQHIPVWLVLPQVLTMAEPKRDLSSVQSASHEGWSTQV